MKKRLGIKIMGSVLTLSLSLASTAVAAYTWYSANRAASLNVAEIGATGSDFKSVDCIIYRGDGAYYNCSSHTYYDKDGNVVDDVFSMLEYDRLITEKNTFNNLIFAFTVTYNSNIDISSNQSLDTIVSCSSTSMFTQTDGEYALSDVTKSLCKVNDGSVDMSSAPLNIYQNATSYMSLTSEASLYQGFLYADESDTEHGGYSKSSSDLNFDMTVSASSISADNSVVLFYNLAYSEEYLAPFFTCLPYNDASLSGLAKQVVDFASDLSIVISSEV